MAKLDLVNYKKILKVAEPFDYDKRPEKSLFHSLASSICSQQLSLKAAATIFGRFCALFPDSVPTPQGVLKLKDTQLRSVGLSQAKTNAIKDLSQKTLEGIVPTDEVALGLSDEELIERLVQVKGIGQWTLEMILIFRYRRPDVWPVDDLGVQKGFQLLFPKAKFKKPRDLKPLGDSFKGKRSELAWYCWRALEEEINQNIIGVPVQWLKKPMMVWLKGGKLLRLDFSRKEKPPTAQWPGQVKVSSNLSKKWQKHLEESLKKGLQVESVELSGTIFQQQVWAAIASIPWGETKTYLEVAQMVGNPKGVRAVAQACGANRLPLFIPCHRVVALSGLGGFGGGIELKKALLQAEKK